MNGVIDNILKRRSVRLYEQKKLFKDILETIINAANAAPSAANGQPWRFVVVQDEGLRKKMAMLALPKYKKWLDGMPQAFKDMRKELDAVSPDPIYYSAPAVIFVIGSGNTSDLDCPMACENLMLAARSLEIGSCWVYMGQLVLDEKEIRDVLEIKEGEKVYGPILLGYPKSGFPEGPKKKQAVVKWI